MPSLCSFFSLFHFLFGSKQHFLFGLNTGQLHYDLLPLLDLSVKFCCAKPRFLLWRLLCRFRLFAHTTKDLLFCLFLLLYCKYILICQCRSSSLKAWMGLVFMQSKCKFKTSELYFHVALCHFRRHAHQISTAFPSRQFKQGKNIGHVLLKFSLFPLLSVLLPPNFHIFIYFYPHALR